MVAINIIGSLRTAKRASSLVVWSGIVVLLFCAASLPDTPSPLWSVDALQHFNGFRNGHGPIFLNRNRAGVIFLDNTQLVVHALDSDSGHYHSSPLSSDVSAPFLFRAWVLDANSGKLLLSRDWPTSVLDSSIDVLSDGLLVRTGVTLRRLSKALADLQDLTFRGTGGEVRWDLLALKVSRSGKTLMVNRINQATRESYFEILDADTLSPRYSWKQSPALYHLYSISDTEIVAAGLNQTRLMRTTFGDVEWKPWADKFKAGCLNQPTFITKDRLIVLGCDQLLLIDNEGRSDLVYRLGEADSFADKISSSSDGRYIAFSVGDQEVKRHLLSETSVLLTARHIFVYDLSMKKNILTISVTPLPATNYDFALSPNGSKLALLNDRNVSVYSVPVQ